MKQHFLIQHQDELEKSKVLNKPYQMKFKVIKINSDEVPENDEIFPDCLPICFKGEELP